MFPSVPFLVFPVTTTGTVAKLERGNAALGLSAVAPCYPNSLGYRPPHHLAATASRERRPKTKPVAHLTMTFAPLNHLPNATSSTWSARNTVKPVAEAPSHEMFGLPR